MTKQGGKMNKNYTVEELEEIVSEGCCDVECPNCGEGYRLETDGDCVCDCGTLVQSPLVAMGLI